MIFIGDDWAEAHHDVYLMDDAGKRLASRRLPEGLAGIRELHELIGEHVQGRLQLAVVPASDVGVDPKPVDHLELLGAVDSDGCRPSRKGGSEYRRTKHNACS